MLRHIWSWLTSAYDCDDCGRRTPRRRGRAHVRVERREYQMIKRDGAVATQSYRVVVLRCPECETARVMRKIAEAVRDAAGTFRGVVDAANALHASMGAPDAAA